MSKKFAEYSQFDLSKVNKDVLKKWDENQVFAKSMTEREGCPSFVFFEGPPSANGMPGIHHVMARSIKDIFCRYKTMKGYQVKRKAGWDTHGLPVELGVEKSLGITKEDIGKTIAITISLIAWIWAFVLLAKSDVHPAYFVAGHVMVGLACICTSLIALVATIARQIRNVYTDRERKRWPKLVLLMGTVSLLWGLFVIFSDSSTTNGVIGYIMIGLGLVCYSISSKVILLAKIWGREFALANRIPLIPVLTALACLFLASFVFELGTTHDDYFIPARVLAGLGAICFTLFSIVSILESGTSSK
jgi:hypothetical protein